MLKSEDEAFTLFENLGVNSIQHASSNHRTLATKVPKAQGMYSE
jgi:hypothetical protein